MDNLTRDEIFDAAFAGDTMATPSGTTLRRFSINTLSQLAKLKNPIRYLITGALPDTQLSPANDLPYILEFIWLLAAPKDDVIHLLSAYNGDKEPIETAIYNFFDGQGTEKITEYLAAITVQMTEAQASAVTLQPEPGKGQITKN